MSSNAGTRFFHGPRALKRAVMSSTDDGAELADRVSATARTCAIASPGPACGLAAPAVAGLLLFHPSAVVADFHVESVSVQPSETGAELVVHANAVLSGTGRPSTLRGIARRYAKALQHACCIQVFQLAASGFSRLTERRTRKPSKRASVFLSAKVLITFVSYIDMEYDAGIARRCGDTRHPR